MSIGHEALRVQVIELVRSLSNWAGRVIFINGHGGNVPTLASAVVQMRDEQHDVSWLACAFETTSDAHAGAAETSVMLHLAPSRVDMSRAAPGQLAPLADLMAALQSNGVRAVSESGVLGDPTAASSAQGAELMEWLVVDGAARIRLPRLDERGHLVASSVGAT
jgi:creatinine amidohydrolase